MIGLDVIQKDMQSLLEADKSLNAIEVNADSLDEAVLFRQSRYEDATGAEGAPQGDYLNAPFAKNAPVTDSSPST